MRNSTLYQLVCALMLSSLFWLIPQHTQAQTTVDFNFTGAVQTWEVPLGVTSVTLETWGAQGNSNAGNVAGGQGGYATGELSVTGGETLYIYVGSGGSSTTAGGWNGGGTAGTVGCTTAFGGGGGGASDVRQGGTGLANRVIVGAGGGGAGGQRVAGCGRGTGGGGGAGWYGGGGGSAWPGTPGDYSSTQLATGGTQSAGGAGGISTWQGVTPPVPNNNGYPGAFGIGGTGGDEIGSNQSGSNTGPTGANGGGLTGSSANYNPGNNWTGMSGAGGSSYIGGVTGGSTSSGARSGNGFVRITIPCNNPLDPPTIDCSNLTPSVTVSTRAGFCDYVVQGTEFDPADFSCNVTSILVDYTATDNLNGAIFPLGTTPVTWTVSNSENETASCTFNVIVEDNEAPNAVCQNITVQLNASGNATITSSDIDGGSTDACSIGSLSASPSTFDCNDVGINNPTLTVTDQNGNSNSCTASVTVEDNAAPTAVCQDFTLNLDSDGTTILDPADIDGGSSTACGTYSLSVSPNGFDCDDLGGGPYTVTLTVTDDSNNETDNCTANITVADPDSYCCAPPTAVCQNTTVQLDASGNGSITVSDIDGGSTAECDLLSLTATPTTFNCSNVGANTVTLTITDINEDSDNCTATVTVQDNVAPNAVCQNTTVQLDSNGEGSIVAADIDGGSNDACGIASISASTTDFGCADVGDNTVTLTVTDANSNNNTCTATVTVEDNVAPNAVCQNFTTQLDANGSATISGGDIDGGSTDACGIASLVADPASFGCDDIGENPVTLTVTDNNGNSNSCTATVTVEDNVAPNAVCQNTTVQLNDDGNGSIIAADIDGGSNDACGVASIAASPTEFACDDVGDNTVTLTVTDNNGNTNTCTATVTVADNVAPEITLCQGNAIDFNGEEEILSSTGIDFEAEDACGVATVTYDPEYISCEQLGETVPVTVTVTDVNGNSNDCVANVLITGLPCGWMDFGDDGIGCVESNDASYDVPTETFTLESEGCFSTNWSADNAAYVKYELCGDGEIIAHVASMSPIGGGWAGISARESEAPGSKKVALATNLGNFLRREIRTTTNGYSIPQQFFRPSATWLKITRMGNQFIGSASSDGVNWQMVLVANVPMTPCIQFGLYLTNTNAGTLTATFDNVEVTESIMPAFSIPDNGQDGIDGQNFTNLDISIFPNPAKDEIQLDLSSYYGQEVQVEILNQLGQPVLLRQLDQVSSTPERFNLTGWSDGTYYVRVVKDNEQLIKKFVIVK